MSDHVRAGVVGLGFIGSAHVETLRRIGVEVAGVVGSDPQRTRARAATLGVPACDSLEDLLADAAIDVIHVATPNYLHYDQVLAALSAGKHVICEKPLALTSAQTAALVDAAEARGLVNAVCFVYRFFPLNRHVREMIGVGDIGRPLLAQGSYHQDWLLHETDWNWRVDARAGGTLRAVGDIGSHWLDLIEWILADRVIQVMADLSTFHTARRRPSVVGETFSAATTNDTPVDDAREERVETEDAAGLLLRFANGARGTVSLAQVVAGRKNMLTYELAGSKASAAWRSEEAEKLWIGHRERANEVLLRDPSLLSEGAARLITYPGGHAEGFADAFAALFRTVYEAVAAGQPPDQPGYPTFRDGHRAVVLGEAIARSASEERWVEVPDPAFGKTTTTLGATTR